MVRPASCLVVSLVCLLAAPVAGGPDETAQAVARLRAAQGKLPPPSRAQGFAFEGEILVAGKADGTFSVSARPAGLAEGPGLWRLEERRKRGQGEDVVEVHATAFVQPTLEPVKGESKKTEYGETSTWTWSRKKTRLGVVRSGPSVQPRMRFVEDKLPTFTTMAAAILFAQHVSPEAATYAGHVFRPDFEVLLGQDPLVVLELTVEGKQTWRGAPAFVVRGRWMGHDLTLALDPERKALLGWRFARKDGPPVDFLPKGDAPKEPEDALFTEPARSAQAAAVRAGFAFSTNDMEILGDVIHWPTLRVRMGDRVPASVTPEAFRAGLLERLEETAKNPQPPELMRPVLKGMLGTLKEEEIDGDVRVTFPPMFRNLQVKVAEIDGVWYLVELPR